MPSCASGMMEPALTNQQISPMVYCRLRVCPPLIICLWAMSYQSFPAGNQTCRPAFPLSESMGSQTVAARMLSPK